MTPKMTLSFIALALFAAFSTASECGGTIYDPSKYVCWYGYYLCPYANGSPLAWCNGACYSPFQYHCDAGVLALNPIITASVQLTVSNPSVPGLDGFPVHACSQIFTTGYFARTCTYCPEKVVPHCPNSTETAVFPGNFLDVIVPGGQQWYVSPSGSLGFTQPHSAYIPPGSQVGGFQAYENGKLVNLQSPWGWIACRVGRQFPGVGGLFQLFQHNGSEVREGCYGVDVLVKPKPVGFAVWQYT